MSNLAAKIEKDIRAHHLPLLDGELPKEEFILPHYGGLSIANTPATSAALLGVELPGLPPLPEEIWRPFAGGVRCVVRVLVDALGYLRLRRILAAEPEHPFHRLLERGAQLVPLTSVVPSTTTTALTSLWTGRTPAEHGMLGTKLFLRSHSLRANMISFSPFGFSMPEILTEFGLDPARFVPLPGLAEMLAPSGVESHTFLHQHYAEGGLSSIFFRGVDEIHPYVSDADLWVMLRDFLEERAGKRVFINVYLGGVDSIGHRRGPASLATEGEVALLAYGLEREVLSRLSPAAAQGVVLTLLADHGQLDVSPDEGLRLEQHPDLRDRLLMTPTAESRLAYLHPLQGQVDAVRAYVRQHLDRDFVVLDAPQALEAGLFGGGQLAPETAVRLGDLILLARDRHYLNTFPEGVELRGLHGGLDPEEMLVPFVCMRLG
jgi:hypothetical protein